MKKFLGFTGFVILFSLMVSCKETCQCTTYAPGHADVTEEYKLKKGQSCSDFEARDEVSQAGIRCE